MTKLAELKAAYAASTQGEWDYFVASNADRPNSQVLDSADDNLLTHSKGITGRAQSDVLFITLAHNNMPTLLEAVEALKAYSNASDLQFATDSTLHDNTRAILEKLK